MSPNVEVIYKEMIKPSSPTPSHLRNLELSYIDQVSPNFHGPYLFFYTNEDHKPILDHARKTQLLKQSLSKALTIFYPLAGTIIGNDSIDCNDVGALYKEARVYFPDIISLSEIIENPKIEELEKYLPIEPFLNAKNSKLPLAVQTNFFPCGGIIVAVCISHKVADAASSVTFFNSWAAISRGVPVSQIVKPVFCLASHSPHRDNIPDIPRYAITQGIVTKKFVFDKTTLDVLKSQVVASGSKVSNPTRVEALSAFIWKRLMEAVAKSSRNTREMSRAAHLVNFRNKMSPPHSDNSIGNFCKYTVATLPSSSSDHDLVHYLRSAKEAFSSEYVKKIVGGNSDFLFNEGKRGTREPGARKSEVEFCNFTSLNGFPIYEADFGWGEPDWVSKVSFPMKNMVIFMRTKEGDGIEAWFNLLPQDMALLDSDPDFLSVCKFKPKL